ncbi:MAG: YihY/virulence factor BrkB family protein [Bacteroidota bacterium]|nr:YihY/virulence factor BrkB family protein [Bacteroidota bacterium]
MKKIQKNYLKNIYQLLVETFNQFLDDKGFKMSAALSYYAAFSLGPLLIIIISIAGFIFGEEAARGELAIQMENLVGHDGAVLIQTIVKGAANTSTGIISTVISVVFLVLGSLAVFLELQESLNIIWGVEQKPGRVLKNLIKNRINSFSMVIATGFLLAISLLINSFISLLYNYLGKMFDDYLPVLDILNIVSSFVVVTLLFALIFKYLPDVIISWKYVWLGSIITSVLFSIGKYLIGLYLGKSSYSSTYGAAASFVILFIWIYYSGIILFFGAEFTQVLRRKYGKVELKPDSDGLLIPKISELIKSSYEKITK